MEERRAVAFERAKSALEGLGFKSAREEDGVMLFAHGPTMVGLNLDGQVQGAACPAGDRARLNSALAAVKAAAATD